ncbi:ornithine carbamoyltransferase [Robbsia sp. KACC 23696]|uniref:ornithine carbamoyltransferase n=1 Tax=Robbsia sp. KACC 23696 TaxID=3149231 RepID=UPI00325AA82D
MLLKRVAMWTVIGAVVTSAAACAPLSRSQKGAAIGGAAGGALGYVLTGGPIGTIAGAAVGGVIGAGAGRR